MVTRKLAEDSARILRLQLGDATEQMVNTAYRSMAKACHPDAGGDPAEFVALDRAKCALLEWLKQPRSANAPAYEVAKCHHCGGTGRRTLNRGFKSMTMVCGSCKGTGEADFVPDQPTGDY